MESVKTEIKTKIVENVLISSIDGNKWTEIQSIFIKPNQQWPSNQDVIPKHTDILQFPHLHDVPFNFTQTEVGLLIGMNMPGLIRPIELVYGSWNEPFASRHWLGWAFNGPIDKKK